MGRAVTANAISAVLPGPGRASPHQTPVGSTAVTLKFVRTGHQRDASLSAHVGNLTCPFQPPQPFPSPLHISGMGLDALFWFLLFQVPVPRPGQTRKCSMRAMILVIPGTRGCCCPRASETCSGRTSTREPFVFLACAPVPPPPPGQGPPAHHGLRKPVRGDPSSTRTLVRQSPCKAGVKDPTQAILDVHQVLARPWSTNISQAF